MAHFMNTYPILQGRFRRAAVMAVMALTCMATVAQPPARRRAMADEAQTKKNNTTASAYRDFPTAQAMPENVAWRRDIYRTLDLTKDANAVLYYPTVPQDGRMNLFTCLFHALLRRQIKAYDYTLDGNENFSEKNQVTAQELMDRYKILYEEKNGRFRVNDADLPSEQASIYFIKESEYYDQHTATFHKKVTALCPVLKRGDDYGMDSQYPMFWVKYDDVAPLLGKLMLMSSNVNNAAMMSADDYFTLGAYRGEIYKTTNLQDRILINEVEADSAVTRREQQRIEREIVDFQDHMWGRDSVAMARAAAEAARADSLAEVEQPKTKKTSTRRSPSRRGSSTATVSKSKTTTRKSKSTGKTKASTPKASRTGGGLSVRRQRH